ncbi:MAG: T9SS type A sorting domain-containing protein [Bacteroidetes bacterium]|nr:T9SS type A sorting domain-containing protein [Bacteroidota bacterium]
MFFSFLISKGQITNYVNNGGFENTIDFNNPFIEYKAIGWSGLDSLKVSAPLLHTGFGNVPISGSGYQWPKSGNGYLRSQLYCPSCPNIFKRSNVKNRLKQTLTAGITYCVKMYVTVEDVAPRGIDAIGLYFGDNSVDTIKYNSHQALTFLTPQIQNPIGNAITDTMNWVLISGTFVANGTEKFMVLANFKSDVATTTAVANSTATGNFSEYFIDDISCIDINLPAYAGPDIWGIPTNTVYLGRPQDVVIDEACMWYKLPNATTAIDTAAGIIVTVAATTQTYMVKQDICGNIKYDTVIVYASATGLSEQETIFNSISLFPNPANDVLNINFSLQDKDLFSKVTIRNNLGQLIREEDLKNNSINIKDLPNGVYLLNFYSDKSGNVSKRFVIAR